ncbi:hypothetical protein HK097_005804 [Rhizophlyctis rosea]|uniref:Uncharacterized protein n=1 Tax=Rhizophlyctis rosea TaxID=64517 RepID=A0AAD5WY83_9FUNG|nr:hypothetical protein HK097_005804 [Rhizophlyctis rosea]
MPKSKPLLFSIQNIDPHDVYDVQQKYRPLLKKTGTTKKAPEEEDGSRKPFVDNILGSGGCRKRDNGKMWNAGTIFSDHSSASAVVDHLKEYMRKPKVAWETVESRNSLGQEVGKVKEYIQDIMRRPDIVNEHGLDMGALERAGDVLNDKKNELTGHSRACWERGEITEKEEGLWEDNGAVTDIAQKLYSDELQSVKDMIDPPPSPNDIRHLDLAVRLLLFTDTTKEWPHMRGKPLIELKCGGKIDHLNDNFIKFDKYAYGFAYLNQMKNEAQGPLLRYLPKDGFIAKALHHLIKHYRADKEYVFLNKKGSPYTANYNAFYTDLSEYCSLRLGKDWNVRLLRHITITEESQLAHSAADWQELGRVHGQTQIGTTMGYVAKGPAVEHGPKWEVNQKKRERRKQRKAEKRAGRS